MYEFNAAGFEVQLALARGSSRGSILQSLPEARVNISAPILQGQYCSCHRMQLLPCTKPSALQHGHWPWRNSIRDNYLVHITAMHIIWATVGAFVLQYSDQPQSINSTWWGYKNMMTKEIEVSTLLLQNTSMGEMLIYLLPRCPWTPSTGFWETKRPWGRFSWGTSSLEGEQPHFSSLFRRWWIWQWQLCVYTLALTKKTFPRKLEGKDVPTGSTKLKTASGEEIKADRGKFVQVGEQWEMKWHLLGVQFNTLRQKGRCWGFCQAIGKLSVLHCQAVFKLWFSNWHSRNQHNCHISGEQQQQEGVRGKVWLCWVERGLPRYRPGSVDLRESPKVWPDVPKSAIWPSVLVNTVQIKTFCETRNI